MGVDESTHKPEYVTSPDKLAVEKLREAAKSASQVILATDPDREGEAIAAHIANCLGAKYNSIMHRITYTEVKKENPFRRRLLVSAPLTGRWCGLRKRAG